MRALFLCISFIMVVGQSLKAQNAVYLSEGSIEYEKKVQQHASLKGDDAWSESLKKSMPKFKTTYHNLFFRGQTTLYKPGRKVEAPGPASWNTGADENIVHSILDQHLYTARKEVYDQAYLVSDSTRNIRWKITDETRTIAGFECRRANALILDSVYIVAFYTDAILTRGGPESISGLPGMILGLAIPEQHVTWFASSVKAETISDNLLAPPVKGKKVTYKQMIDDLSTQLKRWGDWGKRAILAAML